MREFRYKAITGSGEVVAGIRRAPDVAALTEHLVRQGLTLLDSRPTLGSLGMALSLAGRAGKRELRDFTLHMGTSLSAGVPVITALRDFEQDSAGGAFKAIITDIREEISSGTLIAEALGQHPEVFGNVYIAMVAAGQNSGNLDESFAELVSYLEWFDDLHNKTKQALVYPAVLFSGVIGLFLLLMLFVIPRFVGIFEGANFELPPLTQRVLGVWDFFKHWWHLIVGGALMAAVGGTWFRRTERGRYWTDYCLLRLPVVGSFAHKLALSRFSKHFALLFGSGTDLLRLLGLLKKVVGNAVLEKELELIHQRVTTGETLAASFAESPWFPPMIQRLISVGEKAGQLDNTLLKAAEYLDKEIPRALKQAFTLLEAIIIAILGGLIAISALSILLPILQLRNQLV